ncbi:hypothetical protein BU23DRAFT_456598 [Bimuria novae-zelandiae CBS 107.79]|uniref:Zn(2)-C6 fungal-type domain-containing protein n=1 Tax=Bimuria novae-zelandiae CBS 107.79 TaxID=1447943 RepID=A0A6A5VGL6_9PLEO|nr:hypothetical protein BU23DRAFT_456598 [Bimuria novae-zelandiae CBS 107.79]
MIHPPTPFTGAPLATRTPALAPALPQPQSRSPGEYGATSYSHSTSPSTASGGLPESSANDHSGLMISPTAHISANLNTQKRAYRQRRKDPSCDACRERKVKCDATETTACSECSSRNHKCQFTKDTNRRMSSIKQVQDLQSQIAELQQERQQLLTRMGGQDSMELEPHFSRNPREQRPPLFASGRRIPAPPMPEFDNVRDNIRTHSAGIFQTPKIHQGVGSTELADRFPDLPPRADFAHISRSYLDTTHEICPVLHWPTFQSEVDQVYTSRSFTGMSREWVSMYFAVLACGCLNIAATPYGHNGGMEFYDIASQAMTPWPQDPNIVHARLLFLLGLYATENNMKSAGSVWFACAARVAQTLSLNYSDPAQRSDEVEMRRRVWWAIYVQDRITSFVTNLPLIINDADCDDLLPSPIHDRYIGSQAVSHPHNIPEYPFVAIVRIARLFSGIHNTLKSSRIEFPELRAHENQIQSVLSQLPESFRPDSEARLESTALLPIITLHLARFQLYRRNLSPICPPESRVEALNSCVHVARDTAKAIQRTLQTVESDRDCMRRIASNFICIHFWRCILVLCLQKDYQSALTCVRALAAIRDMRKINTACGKNTLFFLEQLAERNRQGAENMYHLVHDEEILAYASGDLQSELEHSWAWGATSTATSPNAATYPAMQPSGTNEFVQGGLPIRPGPDAPEATTSDWPGWGAVEYAIKTLVDPQKRIAPRLAQGPSSTYYPPPHNPVKRVQLAADAPTASSLKLPSTPSDASRISIANII